MIVNQLIYSSIGSRYGRRSNWFKIHCLIQDQAEMNNRLTEGLTSPFAESQDLVAQYKQHQHHQHGSERGDPTSLNRPSSRTNHSSNGASPSSSDGRAHSVPSPYSSLYEAAKANGFTPRFDSSSPSNLSDTNNAPLLSVHHNHKPTSRRDRDRDRERHHDRHHHERHDLTVHHELNSKDQLHLIPPGHNGHGGTHTSLGQPSPVSAGFPFHPGIPMSPVSPLSPLNPASRFLFHHPSSASLFKGLHNLPKLYSSDLVANYAAAYQSRFMPLHALNPVLKASIVKSETGALGATGSPANSELMAELPEQEGPIDLSVKPGTELSLCVSPPPPGHKKMKRSTGGDGDSGFSPSSEENNNASPLDLTSKRTPEPATGGDDTEASDDNEDEDDGSSPRASPRSNK